MKYIYTKVMNVIQDYNYQAQSQVLVFIMQYNFAI